jgi:hypothetical protein
VAQQTFASVAAPKTEAPIAEPKRERKGERRPIITTSALTMYVLKSITNGSLTLARSSSNPFSPPADHEKIAAAGLPLASPFHEKQSFLDKPKTGGEGKIKNYFGVSKGSRKEKNPKET